MTHELDEEGESFGEFLDNITREVTHQPQEQTTMADLEKTLLVHLAKAAVYIAMSDTPTGEGALAEINAAIALLTAEKPKRTRKSKDD